MIHKVPDRERIFESTLIDYLHGFQDANSRRLKAINWILQTSSDYDTNLGMAYFY